MKLSDFESFEQHIPYSSHVSEGVVLTKSYDLVISWQLNGVVSECESELNLDIVNQQTHQFLKSFASEKVSFYVHVVRSQFTDSFDGISGNYFAAKISDLYESGIKKDIFRKNNIYLTLVYSPLTLLEQSFLTSLTPEKKINALSEQLKIVAEFESGINTFVQRFGGKRLTTYQGNTGVTFSRQLELYNFLITNVWQKVPVTSKPIYNILGATANLYFGNQSGQISANGEEKFFRGVEILEFPESTSALSISSLLLSDCDFVLTQSFSCIPKRKALGMVRGAEKKLRSSNNDAYSQQDALIEVKDEIEGSDSFLGKAHFGLMVYGSSVEEVTKKATKQISILSDSGFLPKVSEYSLFANFFSQLPSVFDLRPRLAPIAGRNFVDLASFHNHESGKRDKNCWGEALAILRTPTKQPYYLNLHESHVGKNEFGEKRLANTSVIGTAGAGKTMLLSFMQIMMQKYAVEDSFDENSKNKRLTTIFLDKDRGAELNIRALGGKYYIFENGKPTGWNPFGLSATNENISFVKALIRLLCSINGEILTARQQEEISQSVDAVMHLPLAGRTYGITRCIESLNQSSGTKEKENDLVLRLTRWSGEGEYGWIFDNQEDSFNIGTCNNFGIDGTKFLDEKEIRSPISLYILHRVSEILDGRRVVIFMDEFWKWIADDVFADFAYNKLKTIRKLNGLLVAATQSPDEILKHQISRAVIEVCATQIFLANPKATKEDYVNGFKVTEEEYNIIKNLDPSSRCFLVKKSSLRGDSKPFSAVVRLDLKSLGENTKILSSSADNLKIFEEIFKEEKDPEVWVDEFLKVAI